MFFLCFIWSFGRFSFSNLADFRLGVWPIFVWQFGGIRSALMAGNTAKKNSRGIWWFGFGLLSLQTEGDNLPARDYS